MSLVKKICDQELGRATCDKVSCSAQLIFMRLATSFTPSTILTYTTSSSYFIPTQAAYLLICELLCMLGRAIAQAVSCQLPIGRPGFKPGSGHVGFCDGQKWRWGRFSPRTSISPANLYSICFSTIIFTITRGWHNRPGVAAALIASQTK
jgi:hypothetical protein